MEQVKNTSRVFIVKYASEDNQEHEMLCAEHDNDSGTSEFNRFAKSILEYCNSSIRFISSTLMNGVTAEQVLFN